MQEMRVRHWSFFWMGALEDAGDAGAPLELLFFFFGCRWLADTA